MSESVTEKVLSELFLDAVTVPSFTLQRRRVRHVVSEMDSWQGVADFVITPTPISTISHETFRQLAEAVTTRAAAQIVASLPREEDASQESLQESTGLSTSVLRRYLHQLETNRIVESCGSSRYRLDSSFKEPNIELWAFELKLSDWKRALYQALRYRAFANRVSIVVPEFSARRVARHIEYFRSFDVGVIVLDTTDGSMRTVVRARETGPASRFYYLYAMAVFLRRLGSHGVVDEKRGAVAPVATDARGPKMKESS